MDTAFKIIILGALETIKEGCREVSDCTTCPFFIKSEKYIEECCMFDTNIMGSVPCDWDIEALKRRFEDGEN